MDKIINVLVVGQGGREHALVRELSRSPRMGKLHALPGSDGMGLDCKCHPGVAWQDFGAVTELVRREQIDLVVIGPEIPLAGGLSDRLRSEGIRVIGPSQQAARLESSKIFAKEFMQAAGAPTSRFCVVESVAQVLEQVHLFTPPYVLKADGLAAGKGVVICETREELERAAKDFFERRILGEAGARALLEQFLPGYELSYLILTEGENFEPLPFAQDHKRLTDGDKGPNTGGMGVVAPMRIDPKLLNRINEEVVKPVLKQMTKENLFYRGVLYIGLMITETGPQVIEFNVRFGDPEAQALLPLLAGDWADVFWNLAEGKLNRLNWSEDSLCCVVLAAEGYPDRPVAGARIAGLDDCLSGVNDRAAALRHESYILHAGTKKTTDGVWTANGGRVLNIIGRGPNLASARHEAYHLAEAVQFQGKQMRHDIGHRVL